MLNPALNPDQVDAAPTDKENVEALKSSVDNLRRTAGDTKGPGAVASRRLADALEKLANGDEATRNKAQDVFVTPLKIAFGQLRNAMQAEPVTLESLPPELVSAWKSKDGHHPRRGAAEGRSQRQRHAAQICGGGARCRADRDRRAGLDPEIR